jgi:DUF2975 family protein
MKPQPPSGAVKTGNALVTFLLVLALAFGVFSVVSVGVGLARQGDSLFYGSSLSVPLELSPDEVHSLPPGVRLSDWPAVTVDVKDPTTKQMLLRSATDIGPLLLFIAGLWLLRSFMRSVMEGDPFGAPNVQRLRRLGLLLVAGAPAVELLNYSLRLSFYNDLPPHPFTDLAARGFSVPGAALLGGLGAYILAEVFAYGARLREDVEATV